VDITELFGNLAEPFIALSEQNEIRYDLDIHSGMIGMVDKDKIEKIIFNLLSNAFKYTRKNEQVIFSAGENKIKKELEINVANSGIELPAEQLNQLFDKFYVATHNAIRSDKFGTGIGLAFTHQLVTMLNGKITVCNENGWIIFKVFLPLHGSNEEGVIHQRIINDKPSYLYQTITAYNGMDNAVSTEENNKDAILENLLDQDKKNILVVEDEPEIRFLLKDILKENYIVYEAEDGQEAISLIERVMPDIVICDVMMPRMNGLELCHKIKNEIATCHIPFILLTARGSEEHHMEGYEVGADAYIAKPFNTAHLKLRIRKLLEYRQKLYAIFKSNSSAELLNETDMPGSDKEFLTRVVRMIEENIENSELNAGFLEKEFCMSKMQLYRKLKSLTGMTPGEFIRHLRLKVTAQLLITTNLTVTEIFFRTGFNNQSYFFREFKKAYNCAPNEYREQNTVRR
jgi:DNA-binding response OmpR family regulator